MDLSYCALHLSKVKVHISGKVLAYRGVHVTQSTVKGGATHADHHSHQTKQKEKQAGVFATNICETRVQKGKLDLPAIHPFSVP